MQPEQMPSGRELRAFYDQIYSSDEERGHLYARWRELSAQGKVDHLTALCGQAGIHPARTLEVGCGDGALLAELRHRGFQGVLQGVEITEAAVEIAAARPEIDAVALYDGEHLPFGDREYDLGFASHVVEHVPSPEAFLAELARVSRAVLIEVPLEDNLSARRGSKREQAHEIGHLQRLSRAAVRAMVARAGLRVVAELDDPLPRAVHTFFAETARERAVKTATWVVRAGVHRSAPDLARRLFTVHYACLCLPRP